VQSKVGEIWKGNLILHLFGRSLALSCFGFIKAAVSLRQSQVTILSSMLFLAANTIFLAPSQQKKDGVGSTPLR
jgi:hypothetical protein